MEKVLVEKTDGIVHVRINRPEVYNACDGEAYNAIADAWDEPENDPELRVGILSGKEKPSALARMSNGSVRPRPKDLLIACIRGC